MGFRYKFGWAGVEGLEGLMTRQGEVGRMSHKEFNGSGWVQMYHDSMNTFESLLLVLLYYGHNTALNSPQHSFGKIELGRVQKNYMNFYMCEWSRVEWNKVWSIHHNLCELPILPHILNGVLLVVIYACLLLIYYVMFPWMFHQVKSFMFYNVWRCYW
jgi:hypothetical protein